MIAGNQTILVVEDYADLRDLIEQILRRAGYRVILVGDGASALKAAADHPGTIDLLFTDITLPVMSGPELATALAPSHPETRVLFTSGLPDAYIEATQVSSPATRFISKPFMAEALLGTIQEILEP